MIYSLLRTSEHMNRLNQSYGSKDINVERLKVLFENPTIEKDLFAIIKS
jgi:hypothetical protein